MGITLDAGLLPAIKQATDFNHDELKLREEPHTKTHTSDQGPAAKGMETESQAGSSQQNETSSFHNTLDKKIHKKSDSSHQVSVDDPAQQPTDQPGDSSILLTEAAAFTENSDWSQLNPETPSTSTPQSVPTLKDVTLPGSLLLTENPSASTLKTSSIDPLTGITPSALQNGDQNQAGANPIPIPLFAQATGENVPEAEKTATTLPTDLMAQPSALGPGELANTQDNSKASSNESLDSLESPVQNARLTETTTSFIQAIIDEMETSHKQSGQGTLVIKEQSPLNSTDSTPQTEQNIKALDLKAAQDIKENSLSQLNPIESPSVQGEAESLKFATLTITTSSNKDRTDTSVTLNDDAAPIHLPTTPPHAENPPEFIPSRMIDPMASIIHPARSLAHQILESVHSAIQGGQKTVTIDLTPPELGRVTIRFQEHSDGIQGELEVSRIETRYDVERALPQIIHNLQTHGIQIRKMEVNVNVNDHPNSDSQQHLQDGRQQHAGGSQQQSSDERWSQQQNMAMDRSSIQTDGTLPRRSMEGALSSEDPASYFTMDTDSINMLV